MDFVTLGIIAASILVAIVVIGIIMTSLYTRAARDKAYVRTGLGGKKVVLDGGSVLLPIFHSDSWDSLSTLRLEVKRAENESLITGSPDDRTEEVARFPKPFIHDAGRFRGRRSAFPYGSLLPKSC